MCPYYILQIKQKNHWKIFRQNNRIQVYREKEKVTQAIQTYEKEYHKPFRIKEKKHHPKIEYPKCLWQDVE